MEWNVLKVKTLSLISKLYIVLYILTYLILIYVFVNTFSIENAFDLLSTNCLQYTYLTRVIIKLMSITRFDLGLIVKILLDQVMIPDVIFVLLCLNYYNKRYNRLLYGLIALIIISIGLVIIALHATTFQGAMFFIRIIISLIIIFISYILVFLYKLKVN